MKEQTGMTVSRGVTRVLVTDDDMAQRLLLRRSLEEEGYDVVEAENGTEALARISEDTDIRLLLTDLAMPQMDGYDLINAVRRQELRHTYIIVLTSFDDRESLLKALELGADDYLTKPVFPDELKLRLKSGIRLIRLESQEALVFSMAKLAEYRSNETGYHLERVYHYTRILSRDIAKNHPEYQISLSLADEIARVSPLHDIGKVSIPDTILHKPGKLTEDEFEIMKTHTNIGGKFLEEIHKSTGSPYLYLAYEMAMYHHERWNGKFSYHGKAGEEIPVPARIMALADVYDALTSRRSYKDAFPHEVSKSMIVHERGKHFDPVIVDSFLRQEDAWLAVKLRYPE